MKRYWRQGVDQQKLTNETPGLCGDVTQGLLGFLINIMSRYALQIPPLQEEICQGSRGDYGYICIPTLQH